MKTKTLALVGVLLFVAVCQRAAAAQKLISGVPNYDQDIFPIDQAYGSAETGDCVPVACAMLHGYHDANGWPRLIPYGSNAVDQNGWGIDTVVRKYKQQLGYIPNVGTSFGDGYWDLLLGNILGDAIVTVVHYFEPSASFGREDDDWTSWTRIQSYLNANLPCVLLDLPRGAIDTYKWEGYSTLNELPGGHGICAVGWSDVGGRWVMCNMGWLYTTRAWFNYDGDDDWYISQIATGGFSSGEDDDAYEDNDTISTARQISPGTISNLRCLDTKLAGCCYSTSYGDWFKVNASAGASLSVTSSFTHSSGNLDLRVYDPSQTAVGSSTGTANSESVSVSPTGAGYYYIFVYGYNNAQNLNYSLAVGLISDTNSPTVSITNPAANARFTNNAVITVQGTAADNWQVAAVNYQLNGGGWNIATGTTNWQTTVTLVQGTNTFQVFSVDSAGNNSLTNSRNFVLVLTAPIVVQTNGVGTVSPNYNGQMLEIGKSYSMTATAGTGFMFSNWSGSVPTNGPTVKFIMASDLVLTANFVDVTKPTNTITAPTANQRLTNTPVFTVTGTARDNAQVASVWCQLNGGEWTNAVSANGWTNWVATVSLIPGTNSLKAYAVDAAGSLSTTNSVTFVNVVVNQLQIQATGQGTLSPNYSNAWLEIGRKYTNTATGANGHVFTNWVVSTNWVGGVTSTNAALSFIMQSNLTFQVAFADVTKPTVALTNAVKTYTNLQTVTVSATASDNVGVTNVGFYDNSMFKGNDSTPPYTYDWSFTATDNGTNAWTARAYDAAGNAQTSSAVTLTVSIDITPPTVVITTPTNGQVLTTTPFTVTGTATDPGSPTSGLSIVQVRLNDGNWTNATGTTSWTRTGVTLSNCANTIEARSLDKAGNYSAIASNFVFYTPPNTVPNTPTNVSPANGLTGVSLTPMLQASDFSDSDCVGDTHAASQWQVLNSTGVTIVWDSGTNTTDKTTVTVPTGKLVYASNYVWKVRYRDSRSAWSAYSTQSAFTTAGPALSISRSNEFVILSWTNSPSGFYLESNHDFSPNGWELVSQAPTLVSNTYRVTHPITGAKKMFHLTTQPHPVLNATVSNPNIVLTWPTNVSGFTLQWSTNLLSTNWTTATPLPVVVNGQYAVTNNMTNNFRFYRLKK